MLFLFYQHAHFAYLVITVGFQYFRFRVHDKRFLGNYFFTNWFPAHQKASGVFHKFYGNILTIRFKLNKVFLPVISRSFILTTPSSKYKNTLCVAGSGMVILPFCFPKTVNELIGDKVGTPTL